MEKEASSPPLWSRLRVLSPVASTQVLHGQAAPPLLAALAGSWQWRRAKPSTDEVMCLAELIHGMAQDTQTGDQGQQNGPSWGEPASRLASAHQESMHLWCMWCVWRQKGPARSLHECSIRRIVVKFEQRHFDSMRLSDCICLLAFFPSSFLMHSF